MAAPTLAPRISPRLDGAIESQFDGAIESQLDSAIESRVPTKARPGAAGRILRWLAVVAFAASLVAGALVFGTHLYLTQPVPAPPVPQLSLVRVLSNDTRVPITTTTPSWKKLHEFVTVDRLRSDHTLWNRMQFRDWDSIPQAVREPALLAMINAHRDVMGGPLVWREMTPDDWDGVPQPIRAIVFLRMVWYWTIAEDVGADFGFEPVRLAPTIGAIVMAESWFEHRALNENPYGNRDLGLAQCSDPCRRTIASMAEAGEIDFAPSEAEYFNPWIAARVAVVWFERELTRASGDVELAIRAYHRGIDNALDEKGEIYLKGVLDKRERYVLKGGTSATWQFLAKELRRRV
jgi:hypothetical protein